MKNFIFFLLSCLAASSVQAVQVGGLSCLEKLSPGASKQIAITLISDKDTPELVEFKLCNYHCNSEGQHFFEDAEDHPRSNISWIRQSSYREIIQAGETKDINLTITAPQDSSLAGSYWSVLLIEPSTPVQTLAEAEKGFQLQVKIRYAYHIVTNVSEGTPALKIIKKDVEENEDAHFVVVDALNTGNAFLNPKMTLKLFSSKGKLERTIETRTERLYPNTSARFMANTEKLPAGAYTAFLLLDNGDGRLFGDTFEMAIP